MRRATWKRFPPTCITKHFYPRSPCGERLKTNTCKHLEVIFLSTLSLRRATSIAGRITSNGTISIHALLAESDKIPNQCQIDQKNFYPRSPCGERHDILAGVNELLEISIHALLAESDSLNLPSRPIDKISIHALLAESDSKPKDLKSRRMVFLSTLSLRRATS